MSIEQSPTSEEIRRIISTQYTTGTMARDQYQCYWTTAQVKWNGCYCGNSRQIYEDDQAKGNYNQYIFRRNRKDLPG